MQEFSAHAATFSGAVAYWLYKRDHLIRFTRLMCGRHSVRFHNLPAVFHPFPSVGNIPLHHSLTSARPNTESLLLQLPITFFTNRQKYKKAYTNVEDKWWLLLCPALCLQYSNLLTMTVLFYRRKRCAEFHSRGSGRSGGGLLSFWVPSRWPSHCLQAGQLLADKITVNLIAWY